NRLQWRQGDENGCDALHVLDKAHVIIPLVVDGEGLDAARDLVPGEILELRRPPRVDRPERLEVAAHPSQIVLALFALVDLDAVVDGHEARPRAVASLTTALTAEPPWFKSTTMASACFRSLGHLFCVWTTA